MKRLKRAVGWLATWVMLSPFLPGLLLAWLHTDR
jgi:hypothetical protein